MLNMARTVLRTLVYVLLRGYGSFWRQLELLHTLNTKRTFFLQVSDIESLDYCFLIRVIEW